MIWDNASGDPLTTEQGAAFRTWVENGGSFLRIHGAGGDPVENHNHTSLADWKWQVDTLIGAQFVVHSGIVPVDTPAGMVAHCLDKGHAVYSALGHAGQMYTEPLMIELLGNAMSWGLAESGKSCSPGK